MIEREIQPIKPDLIWLSVEGVEQCSLTTTFRKMLQKENPSNPIVSPTKSWHLDLEPQPVNLCICCAQAVVLRETQNEAREAKRKRDAAFKAAPAPAHPPPRPPRPSRQQPTAAQTPDLALRSRSVARAEFDAAVAEKQRKAEVRRWHQTSVFLCRTAAVGKVPAR